MVDINEPDLERRAFAAYFRTGDNPDQPSDATVEYVDGLPYVALRNQHTTLAVYRVRSYDGRLRRLRRWPSKLNV